MDLISFLKTHTKINNGFIDDFFGLYKLGDKYNFSINLEDVAKWIGAPKGDLKETLLNSHNAKIDYKITMEKRDPKKMGRPSETIMLTPKCFKILAMKSKTKKAVQVREYYYEIEQVLDQYKEYIIKGLEDKIEKLEQNQKPKINPTKGVIYIIETADGIGHYKIGKTKNLKQRLNQYNGDKKDEIIPLYIYETDDIDIIEKCVKTFAKKYQYRKYKEVYKTDINMLKELINDCADFNEKTNLKYKWTSNRKETNNYYVALYKE